MSLLDAAYYADRAVQHAAEIIENVRLARETYRVRFHAPALARRIVPGQFLMLRLAGINDPLIGRPLALYDTVLSATGEATDVDVIYLVKGKLTSLLCQLQPGQRLDVWGPLGNGFDAPSTRSVSEALATQNDSTRRHPAVPTEHLIMVAGGIGQTPFLALAQEALGRKDTAIRRAMCPGRCTSPFAMALAPPIIWPALKILKSWGSTCAWRPMTAATGITAWSPIY
jgi:dihydroorotate dehydrogenase electron transfer subunit